MEPDRTESAFTMPEAVILAVETSSRVGSVALARGATLLAESVFSAALRHSVEVLPAIRTLLKRFDYTADAIDQVHIAVGPGSFTGLRIAVALAKTMALARGVRIVGVDSLDVIAANTVDATDGAAFQTGDDSAARPQLATVLDAKRGQFYAAVYDWRAAGRSGQTLSPGDPAYVIPAPAQGRWEKTAPDRLMTAREIIDRREPGRRLGMLGDGLLYHREEFRTDGVFVRDENTWSPRAGNVHRLGYQKAVAGRFADPLTLTPFYLRGPQVTPKQRT